MTTFPLPFAGAAIGAPGRSGPGYFSNFFARPHVSIHQRRGA